MSFLRTCRLLYVIIFLMGSVLMAHLEVWATPQLVVQAGDVSVAAGDTSGYVPIYLLSVTDSVAAFELTVRASDSAAVEFLQTLDTTGTLISGWKFSLVNVIPGGIQMIWLPNAIGQFDIPSIAPGQQIQVLVKLPFVLHNLNPEVSYDFTVEIDTSLVNFGFSSPLGYLIGVRTDTLVDTTCYRCLEWIGTGCNTWEEVFEEPCDSTSFEQFYMTHFDTSKTWVFNGSIGVTVCCVGDRGNVNGDPNDQVDLSDLARMIAYLTGGASAPSCKAEADLNASGAVDLSDLTWLISYLVSGGVLQGCG